MDYFNAHSCLCIYFPESTIKFAERFRQYLQYNVHLYPLILLSKQCTENLTFWAYAIRCRKSHASAGSL